MPNRFELRGLTKLVNKINIISLGMLGEAERIADRAGRIIERRAKENITGRHGHQRHIITGNLRRSIDTKIRKVGAYIIRIDVGTDAYYALYVELKDKTGGYLFPALQESREEVLNYIQMQIAGRIIAL